MKHTATLLLVTCFSFSADLSSAGQRPNVLFLFADDQRADTIAAHGNPHIKTPNLDLIARNGVSFRRNYCFGSNSGAVCVPSRAMLMTGKMWLHTNNQMKGELLLPEHLGNHGYNTFMTGKWHNGAASLLDGFQTGKALYLGGMSDHTEVFLQDVVDGHVMGNKRIGRTFSSQIFADAAIDFINGYDGQKPFFAYVAFTAPHDPRQPPQAYREAYYQRRPPLPENFLPQHPFDNGHLKGGRDESLAAWPRTREVISDQLCEYYGMITHLDEQVGRIMEALKVTGQYENTILIYAADHGLAMGSHGLLGKQSVYEHSMQCPLMIVGPGIPANRETYSFTYLLDLYPTICELVGLETPEGLDGHSVAGILQDNRATVRDSVFLPFSAIQRSVRDSRWKLIAYPQVNYMQLFDMQSDPSETRNLAADSRYAMHKKRMVELMSKWQAEIGDEQTLTVPKPKSKTVDLTGAKRIPDRWQPKWIRDKYFGGAETSEKNQEITARLREEFGN